MEAEIGKEDGRTVYEVELIDANKGAPESVCGCSDRLSLGQQVW